MGWKEAESIFSVTFSWTLPLSDRKVPIIVLPHLVNGKIRRTIQLSYSFTLTLMMRTAQGAFETSAVTFTMDIVTLETVTIEPVTMDTVYTVNNRPQSHEQSCSKYLWYFMKNTDSSYPSNNRREWSIFPWWAFVTLARHFPKMEQFTNHKHLHKKLKVNVVRNAISGIWCWEFFFLNR